MFGAVAARLDGVRRRLAEPHRAYHTQTHVDAMLAGLPAIRDTLVQPDAAELAVWYHDAVYDPAAVDNEARSAALLLADMAGLADPALLRRAEKLVLWTAAHAVPDGVAPDLAADAAAFLDLDMAVLGADRATYDAYERGIAAEFVPVHGAAAFRAGRARFLQGMLGRERLFLTARSHAALDAAARANIGRAIAALGAG